MAHSNRDAKLLDSRNVEDILALEEAEDDDVDDDVVDVTAGRRLLS